jgi:hypothetical protein
MSDGINVNPYLLGCMVAVFLIAILMAIGTASEVGDWRRYECTRAGADLVADSLCVRPDSSWRLVEPPK